MTLREIQRQFYHSILSSPIGEQSNSELDCLIKTAGQLSPQQRIDIYRNTGISSRIKALQQIYPACELILGKRTFNRIAYEYAINTPSISNDLNTYGEMFASMLDKTVQTHNELAEFSYLCDLGKLEWLWHKVYYQENDNQFDFDVFAVHSQKPDEIILTLSHSVELMVTHHPIHFIWQQHRDRAIQTEVIGLNEPDYLCIYRKDFIPKVTKINKAYFSLLTACRQGRTLGYIALAPELSVGLQALPELIKQGWICGFTTHNKDL
ncbi:MAG: hypothetical protein ACJA13_002982 [Paraglaciecola sp.]|jgi:hypothetical protein